MKTQNGPWICSLAFLAGFSPIFAQATPQSQDTTQQTGRSAGTEIQQKNIQEYIELLRTDVRRQKAQIIGAVLALDTNQAAKFWPIYNEYDAELSKINNLRVANIQEYARNYGQMTDAKADELMRTALDFRKRRSDLMAKYYDRVKASLGAVQAARFLQVENQLLEIIDLQIESSLPIVAPGS